MKTKGKTSRKKGKCPGKCVPPFPIEFRLKVARLREEDGYPAQPVAEQFGISQDSVYRWAKRYRLYGQQGLVNQPRGKSTPTISASVTQSIIDLKKENTARGAKRISDIKPLIDMCNADKLFDVQDWIAAGKPVNLPLSPEQKARKKHPLQIAIEKGFHSLVQVLLEGGAEIEYSSYDNALTQALYKRRLDFIQLLVQHGADVRSVEMTSVFDSWDPAIMEYFIEHGADVESCNPLAFALCYKIRTALGVFKRHKDRFLSFQEQGQHCPAPSLQGR